MKKDTDELIHALEGFLEVVPDGKALRLYIGNAFDDAETPPEEFVTFARELLDMALKIREKYE